MAMTMNGGAGPNSYFRNSKIQEEGSNQIKGLLRSCIKESFELSEDSLVVSIADFGCSVGPNTFSCVKNIIEAVQEKLTTYRTELELPEFQVFFNDLVNNDFNTLFKALPSDRKYIAAGVPGSFHNRLFPRSSINLMHSAFALQWLTKVPGEITKENSPLWNKGRITYALSSSQIVEAFRAQFLKDAEAFFKARSDELSPGGLLAVRMPCRAEGTLPSQSNIVRIWECLGEALADMVKEGLITESLLNSFNAPFFIPTASEVNRVVSNVKHLRTERLEEIHLQPKLGSPEEIHFCKMHTRAIIEQMLCKHFGPDLTPDLTDEIFDRYAEKLEKFSNSPLYNRTEKIDGNLFLLVKHDCDSLENAACTVKDSTILEFDIES